MESIAEEFKIRSSLTQEKFCEHIEDGDFFEKNPDPILVEGDNGQKCICISWARRQKVLREIEMARKMARPGYDPEKEETYKIIIDRDIYNQLEIICAANGHTVEGVTEEFLQWFVGHPEAAKSWVEECRKDGILDECMNNPFAEIE